MTVNVTSPVTGAAQQNFTAPTYTLTTDTAPTPNGKQYAVTGIGGTQAGVEIHSVSKPFTHTVYRPVTYKQLPAANPVTGVIKAVPRNTYKCLTRKGALPAANQSPQNVIVTTTIEVPAGVDVYEPEEIRAALSLHIGALSQVSSGFGDTCVNGLL